MINRKDSYCSLIDVEEPLLMTFNASLHGENWSTTISKSSNRKTNRYFYFGTSETPDKLQAVRTFPYEKITTADHSLFLL